MPDSISPSPTDGPHTRREDMDVSRTTCCHPLRPPAVGQTAVQTVRRFECQGQRRTRVPVMYLMNMDGAKAGVYMRSSSDFVSLCSVPRHDERVATRVFDSLTRTRINVTALCQVPCVSDGRTTVCESRGASSLFLCPQLLPDAMSETHTSTSRPFTPRSTARRLDSHSLFQVPDDDHESASPSRLLAHEVEIL